MDDRAAGRHKGTGGGSVRACIGQAHSPVLIQKFCEYLGFPHKTRGPHMKKQGTLAVWRAAFSGLDAANIMNKMRPYLTPDCPKLVKFDKFWYGEGGEKRAYHRSEKAIQRGGGQPS